ncbi:hypothetical protein [Phenylobacterium sp.]|uniref:hypothetical protein n=1 Tax=Phenylobacterium sp. TaxID=1871053 RepID=UPI0027300C44|nr:hypothetical protein [Phenylobacterium sp.]MDP2214989.1 hypothetical protein [Phenylobacterium sp.]
MPWKLAGGLAAFAAALLLAGWIQHQHVRSERLADCQAIASGELARTAGERCPAAVLAQLEAGRAAQACDQALQQSATSPALWGAPPSCSAKVRDLAVRHNAARSALADRERELDQLRSGQLAAIARAEARGASQARRTANANAAIEAAPRDPAGLIVCDDLCLRRLAGEDVPGSGADRDRPD